MAPGGPPGGAGFDERFEELFDLAYRVAFRVLGDRDEATDAAQEALARAERRWARLADAPHGWVVRVAANLAIGTVRKRQRRPPVDPARAERAVDEHATERVDLVRALEHLPRRQRQVVVLRYLADRPEAEVARVLGLSLGSVKTHATRGLRAMRDELGGS
jgi:RNA polymerase sigma factor (sigma-70 family)